MMPDSVAPLYSTQIDAVGLDLPGTYRYLNVVGACIGAIMERVESVPEPEMFRYALGLAVHETCNNIVQHAYRGLSGRIKVVFSLHTSPPGLIVDVHDTGLSFDLSEISTPDLTQPQTSGYGLFLMHQLVDQITYTPELGNNHWQLVKFF